VLRQNLSKHVLAGEDVQQFGIILSFGDFSKYSPSVSTEGLSRKWMGRVEDFLASQAGSSESFPTDPVLAESVHETNLDEVPERQGKVAVKLPKVGGYHLRRMTQLVADFVGIPSDPSSNRPTVDAGESGGFGCRVNTEIE
jgi:hypothetical protein